jgi:hypothetical protein
MTRGPDPTDALARLLQSTRPNRLDLPPLEVDHLVASGERRMRTRRIALGVCGGVAFAGLVLPFAPQLGRVTEFRNESGPSATSPIQEPQANTPVPHDSRLNCLPLLGLRRDEAAATLRENGFEPVWRYAVANRTAAPPPDALVMDVIQDPADEGRVFVFMGDMGDPGAAEPSARGAGMPKGCT